MGDRPRRTWRNLLLDRGFQLRLGGALVLICLLLGGGLAGRLYWEMRVASRVASTGSPSLDAALGERLAQEDRGRLVQMVAGLLVLALVVAGLTLLRTHRMVGPLHVLRTGLVELRAGRYPAPRTLRRGDDFRPLLEEFWATAAALRAAREQQRARLLELAAASTCPSTAAALRAWAEELELG